MMAKGPRIFSWNPQIEEKRQAKLIEGILSEENLKEAIHKVKVNIEASGIDRMPVDQVETYFNLHREVIVESIINKLISLNLQ